MRVVIILFTLLFSYSYSFSQERIDLTKAPSNNNGIGNKSNATLLREAAPTPPTVNNNQEDLSEKYKADDKPSGTFKTVKQQEIQPGVINNNGEVLNGKTQQINLGTGGTKANSTTYFDNEGKIRGTSTTINFGNK